MQKQSCSTINKHKRFHLMHTYNVKQGEVVNTNTQSSVGVETHHFTSNATWWSFLCNKHSHRHGKIEPYRLKCKRYWLKTQKCQEQGPLRALSRYTHIELEVGYVDWTYQRSSREPTVCHRVDLQQDHTLGDYRTEANKYPPYPEVKALFSHVSISRTTPSVSTLRVLQHQVSNKYGSLLHYLDSCLRRSI